MQSTGNLLLKGHGRDAKDEKALYIIWVIMGIVRIVAAFILIEVLSSYQITGWGFGLHPIRTRVVTFFGFMFSANSLRIAVSLLIIGGVVGGILEM